MDRKLRSIAARRAALDAEEANLLRYAEELKLWQAFGFGHMLEYMERAMGYAPHTATERLRVARMIAELPLIADALERGELAHSAVRELSRVAVPGTEEAWLEAARGKSLREIEAMVSGHKPGDLPTDETEPHLHRRRITLEVSPETFDLWRKLHALAAEEHGQRLSDDELIRSVYRRAYGGEAGTGKGASAPAYKIAIKQCADCKRAWQYSGGRDIEVDPAVIECAACDAVHLGSLDTATPAKMTTTVTPRKREQVLARDGHCCTVPGCRRNIGLDLHHISYQSHGGSHSLTNLLTICDLHHQAVHFGKLVIRGTAPDHVTFEFRKPRDRRNITDDDAPVPPSPGASRASRSAAPPSPAQAARSPDAGSSTTDPAAVDTTAAGTMTAGPTAVGPMTAGPMTAGPTAAGTMTARPTAAGPMTARPTAAGPMTAEPTAAGPMTAAPMTAAPMTIGLTAAGPMTAGPMTAGPMTAAPMTAGPMTAEPMTVGLTAAELMAVGSAADNSTAAYSTEVRPTWAPKPSLACSTADLTTLDTATLDTATLNTATLNTATESTHLTQPARAAVSPQAGDSTPDFTPEPTTASPTATRATAARPTWAPEPSTPTPADSTERPP
ncbi:MAG TPA: hypothetical protein VNO30_08400 [Kofleriaceae bacterium]|nr:hypothetical protein [Kofleriaceae bacterium]